MKKMPPIEKVYEAWTAIADGRVIMNEDYATVTSSDGTKEYTVRFSDDKYASDDNATYWQGYPGYPVLAVLMLQGKLPFDRVVAEKWKGVEWKVINTKYKNNYAIAVREVAEQRGIDMTAAHQSAEAVMDALKSLDIRIGRKV